MPRRARYPSDLTDAEWALVAPLVPAPAKDGRKPKRQARDLVAEALTAAYQTTDSYDEDSRRAEVLAALAPLLSALPPAAIGPLWQKVCQCSHSVLGANCYLISVPWCHCCRLQEGNRLLRLPLKRSAMSADGGRDLPSTDAHIELLTRSWFPARGWLDLVRQSGGGTGDPGYEGEPDVVHTPIKKRPNVNLGDVERDLNRRLARVRVGVEWGVGHLKNWRILTTRYRPDLSRIDTDIQATVGLQKLNDQSAERPLTYGRIKAA